MKFYKNIFFNQNKILVTFIVLAVLTRLVFWQYTGRVWEDFLITLPTAMNFWGGNGLTHHLSESRVQSFTSPIGLLIPLIGEAFNQGLNFLRASTLVASAFTIYFAFQICLILRMTWYAQVMLLSYLSFDQLQVMFGMSGMETQFATLFFFMALYYIFEKRWFYIGISVGLGLLTRPEFIFFIVIFSVYLIAIEKFKNIVKVGLGLLIVCLPWYSFSFYYYGSIIPNTIIAKSVGGQFGPLKASFDATVQHLMGTFSNIAPFKEWFFLAKAPVPFYLIDISVFILLLMLFIGLLFSIIRKELKLVLIFVVLCIFFIYRSSSLLSTYYMWYLPPFLGLLFLLSAYGISQFGRFYKSPAIIMSLFVSFMYSINVPFTLAVEKQVQDKIECGVRFQVGLILDSWMGDSDNAVLEPLGYIGYAAFNKTIYDFPGISSKYVVENISKMKQKGMRELVAKINPSFLVLRPSEYAQLSNEFAAVAKNYTQIALVKGDDSIPLEKWGYSSAGNNCDAEFIVLKRVSPPTELSTPRKIKSINSDRGNICPEKTN